MKIKLAATITMQSTQYAERENEKVVGVLIDLWSAKNSHTLMRTGRFLRFNVKIVVIVVIVYSFFLRYSTSHACATQHLTR